MRIKAIILFLILTVSYAFSQSTIDRYRNTEITADEIYAHIKYLASDELEGRYPGTKGDILSRQYLCKEFTEYGLIPEGDSSYVQRFEMMTGIVKGKNNSLKIKSGKEEISYNSDKDFTPLGLTANGKAEGELVFAGYGITAASVNYDDFKDKDGKPLDVKGKIVVIMKYSPTYNEPNNDKFRQFEEIRFKLSNIRDKKPAGIILITGPETDSDDNLSRLSFDMVMQGAEVPVINAKRYIIDNLLKERGFNLSDIQKNINTSGKPHSFVIKGAYAEMETSVEIEKSKTGNIVGLLEGSDPVLKNEVIVIGGHYDHLGFGGPNSLFHGRGLKVHYGADDNASGTSGVLEIAQKLSSVRDKLKRSFLFVCFSGEESGLLGSAYFTKSDIMQKFNIVAMLNMDMVGRLRDDKLIINGTGTSSVWIPKLDELNKSYSFNTTYNPEGFGPSDHSSFYVKDIPVLMFFTDLHREYHTPEDTYDKINTTGEAKVLNFIYDLSMNLAVDENKPDFVKVTTSDDKEKSERKSIRVYVGTVPDFSSNEEGFKISGVQPGSPAEKGGLQAGDLIIKFGDKIVKNIYDYTAALGEYKPGMDVDVVVKRNGEEITLKITLGKK